MENGDDTTVICDKINSNTVISNLVHPYNIQICYNIDFLVVSWLYAFAFLLIPHSKESIYLLFSSRCGFPNFQGLRLWGQLCAFYGFHGKLFRTPYNRSPSMKRSKFGDIISIDRFNDITNHHMMSMFFNVISTSKMLELLWNF